METRKKAAPKAAPVEAQHGKAARRQFLGEQTQRRARTQILEPVRPADDDAAARRARVQPAAAIVEDDGDHARPPRKPKAGCRQEVRGA